MNPLSSNLFTLLTLIVAPAVLTNASSVLGLNNPRAASPGEPESSAPPPMAPFVS